MSFKILHITSGQYLKGYKHPITQLLQEGMFKFDGRSSFHKSRHFYSLDFEISGASPVEVVFDQAVDAYRFLLNYTENVYLRHQQLVHFDDKLVVEYFEHLQKKFPSLHLVLASDILEAVYENFTICELTVVDSSKKVIKNAAKV